MFLEQYWGGPRRTPTPRSPAAGKRHAPFAVTPTARDRWVSHMHDAIGESGMSPEHQQRFWEYVARAAHFLVNTFEEEPPASPRNSLL